MPHNGLQAQQTPTPFTLLIITEKVVTRERPPVIKFILRQHCFCHYKYKPVDIQDRKINPLDILLIGIKKIGLLVILKKFEAKILDFQTAKSTVNVAEYCVI